MKVVSSQRFLIPLQNGEIINVLVEEQAGTSFYKYSAVLNGWDDQAKFETGNTIEETVVNLADLLEVELPKDWRSYGSLSRPRSIESAGASVAA